MNKTIKTANPPLGWQLVTVASLLDEMNESNNIGKERVDAILIKFKGDTFKLERMKGGDLNAKQ